MMTGYFVLCEAVQPTSRAVRPLAAAGRRKIGCFLIKVYLRVYVT